MPAYPPQLDDLLDAVRRIAPTHVVDQQGHGEWFHVRSRLVAAQDLFTRLERHWKKMVSHHNDRFALLYVESGPDCGVWIHYFATPQIAAEYEPGCHRLPSWQ
jgi:hypothetical protein